MSRSGIYDPKYGFIPDDDVVPEKPPITNYDRLISKTPEELAEWLVMIEQRIIEKNPTLERSALYADWIAWLKSPVEVDDG